MCTGLGHVEIASNQRYKYGIEHVVDKFVKDFAPLVKICPTALLLLQSRGRKPFNLRDLKQLVTSSPDWKVRGSQRQHLP